MAKEVRPYLLEAKDTLYRARLMVMALEHSIELMQKTPHGPMECEPPPVNSVT